MQQLEVSNKALTAALEAEQRRSTDLYAAGIDEGGRRVRAVQISVAAGAWPTDLVVTVGEEELTIVGIDQTGSPPPAGARATLATIGPNRVMGVLEVRDAGDGAVVMHCVDRVFPGYWENLEASPLDSKKLTGVRLIAYDPTIHHSGTPNDVQEQQQ